MRTDSTAYTESLGLSAKDPRYAIKIAFKDDGTQDRWFTSHADGLYEVGASVDLDTIRGLGGTTQQLFPNEGRATVGNFSFSLVDRSTAISAELRSQLDAGNGLRDKTVEFYAGDASLTDFNDYALFQTQIVTSLDQKDGEYFAGCHDIQRIAKSKIFRPEVTNIADTPPVQQSDISG